jgi:hypothetical protein
MRSTRVGHSYRIHKRRTVAVETLEAIFDAKDGVDFVVLVQAHDNFANDSVQTWCQLRESIQSFIHACNAVSMSVSYLVRKEREREREAREAREARERERENETNASTGNDCCARVTALVYFSAWSGAEVSFVAKRHPWHDDRLGDDELVVDKVVGEPLDWAVQGDDLLRIV